MEHMIRDIVILYEVEFDEQPRSSFSSFKANVLCNFMASKAASDQLVKPFKWFFQINNKICFVIS